MDDFGAILAVVAAVIVAAVAAWSKRRARTATAPTAPVAEVPVEPESPAREVEVPYHFDDVPADEVPLDSFKVFRADRCMACDNPPALYLEMRRRAPLWYCADCFKKLPLHFRMDVVGKSKIVDGIARPR